MDVHPTKNVSIGIDPYPHLNIHETLQRSLKILEQSINIHESPAQIQQIFGGRQGNVKGRSWSEAALGVVTFSGGKQKLASLTYFSNKKGNYIPICFYIFQYIPIYFNIISILFQYIPIYFNIISIYSKIFQYYFNILSILLIYFNIFQHIPIYFNIFQYISILFQYFVNIISIYSTIIQYISIYSNIFQYIPIYSNIFQYNIFQYILI